MSVSDVQLMTSRLEELHGRLNTNMLGASDSHQHGRSVLQQAWHASQGMYGKQNSGGATFDQGNRGRLDATRSVSDGADRDMVFITQENNSGDTERNQDVHAAFITQKDSANPGDVGTIETGFVARKDGNGFHSMTRPGGRPSPPSSPNETSIDSQARRMSPPSVRPYVSMSPDHRNSNDPTDPLSPTSPLQYI